MLKTQKPKILFVSESVTLAHFARPFELSNSIDQNEYDIHFACGSVYQKFLAASKHTVHTINSISPNLFKQALTKGSPLYNFATLKNYVEEDICLIDKIKPDLIVGDFRLSLSISARLAKIPYATISNAYWSPYAPKTYPVPCISLTKYLGLTVGGTLFKIAAPTAFKVHALAMRKARHYFGLPKSELDLRKVYTDADYTLYADIPSLFPLENPPENHFFIGPILWSPPIKEPDWWNMIPTKQPIIYISMGSSGSNLILQKALHAFVDKKVTIIASSSGENISFTKVSDFFTADYIDGYAAANRADLVICNGGSLTCQQAFAHGKPVIGIANNMDQFLNMIGVSRAKSGLTLRVDDLTGLDIFNSYEAIMQNPKFKQSARHLQIESNYLSEQHIFENFMSSILKRT